MTATRAPLVKYWVQGLFCTPSGEDFASSHYAYKAADVDPWLEEVETALACAIRLAEDCIGDSDALASFRSKNVSELLHRLRARARTPDEH